jgi:hypothetical protein
MPGPLARLGRKGESMSIEIVLRHTQITPIFYHVAQKVARGEKKLSRSMTARELYAWLGN